MASRKLHPKITDPSTAESLGLDVTDWTDVDLHREPQLLLNHHALISLGHDEYWSTAMRNGAQAADFVRVATRRVLSEAHFTRRNVSARTSAT